jgi:adenylylsulfate kinase
MIILQMTGLSGAGKTTLAEGLQQQLVRLNIATEVIDADYYRKTVNKDLGYSDADRKENIRRLGIIAHDLCKKNIVAIIAAINPYEDVRQELKDKYNAKLVWINCNISVLVKRDTKGLYRRALLPDNDPQKITNLTGINDPYEIPAAAELILDTSYTSADFCIEQLLQFCISLFPSSFGRAANTAQSRL